MRVILTVIAGPHKGLEFAFDKHDTFLVGRSRHAHFQLPAKDRFFSRVHFMMEVNPPQCRLIDMGSHNGTYVNGEKVLFADLKAGDQIRAGHTVLRVRVVLGDSSATITFTPPEPSPALPSIPGYTLIRPLGRGPMGTTYLARRTASGSNAPADSSCALKIVQPTFNGSPSQVNAFLLEARTLASLDHPHIARLREVDSAGGDLFFAADYVAGLNATEVIQRDGPLKIARALRLAQSMLHALQYAHARSFVHRDIKPSNVLVGEQDGKETVHLTDFGVARVYQSAPFSGLSLTADMETAAAFMPPEVLFNFKEAHPLADQFSAAAVLYFLLTGQTALDLPKEPSRRFSTLLRRQHVPLNERRGDIPVALADAIHKALSRAPSQRFTSVAEFRSALERSVDA